MGSRRVAVVLSGCGVYDGSEIQEAVLTLLTLDRAGVEYQCLAPNRDQHHVINHLKGAPAEGESRNVLVEAARIARGEIEDLAHADGSRFDAVVFPGGFGAAKNLSTFAFDGARCSVDPTVAAFVRAAHKARRPIAFLCIAPAVAAAVLGEEHPLLTIGDDAGTAAALEALGARHQECPVRSCVVDHERLIVSAPCYMYNARISEVASGIEAAIAALLALI